MICDRIKVIDSDTHVSEPETLWTDRISTKKWGDLVPHVIFDPEINEDRWVMGGKKFMPTAGAAMAGWKTPPPNHPPSLQEADHGSWEIRERLQRMDEYGMYAQVVYPNVGGFGSGNFLQMTDDELRLDCVRAYNDFLVDWTSVEPSRFIPIMAMPFWDVQACVDEMQRAYDRGHRGVLMTNQPHTFGLPRITEQHWDPIWSQAQDMGLSINFHIGSGDLTELRNVTVDNGRQAAYAKSTVKLFLDNSNAILDIILSGMCHRFPELKFVSVESGVGWIPYLLEAMDWQWKNSGCLEEHPEMDLLPSEYFKRQCYGCFWFEEDSALKAIDMMGSENFMFETDFPHPTSMSPGPNSVARNPKEHVEEVLGVLPEEDLLNVLQRNAAKVYNFEV
jgi:predicted TIM-barrel fold metal-dependent hydrolase